MTSPFSSTPATGERLCAAPSSGALKFNAPLLTLGHEIRGVDAAPGNGAPGRSCPGPGNTAPAAGGRPEDQSQGFFWRPFHDGADSGAEVYPIPG